VSETDDKDSKSNEPTEKKISDTIAKGNVPVSREVPVLSSFLALLIACNLLVVPATGRLVNLLKSLFEKTGSTSLNSSVEVGTLFNSLLGQVYIAVLPILFTFMIAGILASLLQNPFQANFERVFPNFSRISPGAGLKRIFGTRATADIFKSLFKFMSVGLIVAAIIKSESQATFSMMIKAPQFIPHALLELVVKLVSSVSAAALILALADTVWSRIVWRKDLRMSRQEVKEEHKEAEGNPVAKSKARGIARRRSSRRMISAMPNATLVITNPTHFAIALRYVRSEGGAPTVLAKGRDTIALKIRKIAEELGIEVIENKPLARAMYEKVEINTEIPQEFFVAVAELIHFLQMKSMSRSVKGNQI
jgi:flagellar biosynthesis protein FlhB